MVGSEQGWNVTFPGLRLARVFTLVFLWFFLLLPGSAKAQFQVATNTDGTITITGYTGSDGDVTIPSTTNGRPVTVIGGAAFWRSTNLISVTIPSSVTNVQGGAFSYCTSLTGVYFQGNAPPQTYPIAAMAFWQDNKATIYYLAGTKGWGPTFDALPAVQWNPQVLAQLIYTTNNGTISITGYSGTVGAAVVPSTINGLPVASIEESAFANCSTLTSVTIPTTVTSIEEDTFFFCTNLTNVTIPGSVTNIGDYSFVFCSSLTNVTIPNGVSSIGNDAFFYCTNLTNVTIAPSVTNIEDWAFQECYRLGGVYFQGNAPVADSTVFSGDDNVTIYYLPKTAGWGPTFAGHPTVPVLFTYTTNHGAITITSYIGTNDTIAIPSRINGLPVTSIGVNAFETATITSATISDGITSIGVQAFSDCYYLTNVTIPNTVTSIGNRAFQFCGLTTVRIPDNVTAIQEATFVGCANLTSVIIGNGVTSIADSAFAYCSSLTNVTIGKNVSFIGSYAFPDSPKLTGIYFLGNATGYGSDVFDSDLSAVVYYLPGATGWGTTIDGLPTVLWLPQVQTSDGNFGVNSNQFGFNIAWASGQVAVVQAATNLAHPVWQAVATNTLSNGSFYFSDPQWSNYPSRFYRITTP